MASRRKARFEPPGGELTKEETAILKHLRFAVPNKTGFHEGDEVQYFSGQKAVDALLGSRTYGSEAKTPKFNTRADVVAFMVRVMECGKIFRARALVPKRIKDVKESDREAVAQDSNEVEESEVDKKKKEEKKDKEEDDEKKKKKKVKIRPHEVQVFRDDADNYVWTYNPASFKQTVIGACIVLGVIAGCLFPLWPLALRQGIYYISMAGLAALGLFLGVGAARTVLYYVINICTGGRHRLWILPNLLEDCGFFESFKPWYTYEYVDPAAEKVKKKRPKDGKKSDAEEKSDKEEEKDEDSSPGSE